MPRVKLRAGTPPSYIRNIERNKAFDELYPKLERAENVKRCKELVLLYPDIGLVDTTMTKLDQHGRSLLHQAAAGDRVKAVKILVTLEGCKDKADAHGDTALAIAARNGNIDCVKALLRADANPNVQNAKNYHSALHAAAIADQIECIHLLCRDQPMQADPTLRTFNKYKASQLARQKGFLRAAIILEAAEAAWVASGKGKRKRVTVHKCSCSYCGLLNATNSDNPALNIVGAHRPEKADDYTALQPPGTRWLKGQSARGFDATATEHAVVMYRVDEGV